MHELSIVASLFEILEEKAKEHRAVKITGVRLKVGKLAGVVPEFLRTAFDMYKQGTLAAEAVLEVEVVPVRVNCQKCRAETITEDYIFICSACGSAELQVIEGLELLLDKVELEI
jgi:hydrogenase nickel incorporation protein HypA/HybF